MNKTEIKEKKTGAIKRSHRVFRVEEQFRLMADAAPMLLWVSGIDNHSSFFNKAWLRFTGRTLSEESGEGWADGVHPDDIENCTKIYNNSFLKQKGFKMEYRLRRHDGQYRWILDSATPRFTKNKKFLGFIGSGVDIHELKEIEYKKDQFINAASHELRTPVTSLSVYLHLLKEYFENSPDKKYRSFVSGAMGQVNKIAELIDQILDLSRIQSGSLNFKYSIFSFGDFVKSIVKKIQAVNPSHTIRLKGNIHSMIKGDPTRLSQALENLLGNALKYSKEDGKIVVALSEDTKFVKVNVIDFGLGINKEYLTQVFERFYRIQGTKEETFPGLGIGLYVSQEIIKKHGGKISAESIRDKETKFTFQIPVYKKQVKHI
ncbi:MAG: PAS domain-containing sensor histidine kinase [Ginsengibacter sp.]